VVVEDLDTTERKYFPSIVISIDEQELLLEYLMIFDVLHEMSLDFQPVSHEGLVSNIDICENESRRETSVACVADEVSETLSADPGEHVGKFLQIAEISEGLPDTSLRENLRICLRSSQHELVYVFYRPGCETFFDRLVEFKWAARW